MADEKLEVISEAQEATSGDQVPVDYQSIVNDRVKKAVLDNYVNTPEFSVAFKATMEGLPSMEHFDEFLKKSVSIGVSPEIALELFVLTLSMK